LIIPGDAAFFDDLTAFGIRVRAGTRRVERIHSKTSLEKLTLLSVDRW
jgi:hypothetical protein